MSTEESRESLAARAAAANLAQRLRDQAEETDRELVRDVFLDLIEHPRIAEDLPTLADFLKDVAYAVDAWLRVLEDTVERPNGIGETEAREIVELIAADLEALKEQADEWR